RRELPAVPCEFGGPELEHELVGDLLQDPRAVAIVEEHARGVGEGRAANFREREERVAEQIVRARTPELRSEEAFDGGEDVRDDGAWRLAVDAPQRVQAGAPRIFGLEANDGALTERRDVARDISGEVAVRVDEQETATGVEIVPRQRS